ncbi:hypothetical protein PsYK624_116480 [Phanerochaete sordida]|uniref:Uncharacterized protein n=1 Tax=Phanerochaete sordida TaxID=48140 RepID=A0A9P3GL43_9APHY|nr:hypothetical protein PsYK624_116480 [Phanerochaete sordida]
MSYVYQGQQPYQGPPPGLQQQGQPQGQQQPQGQTTYQPPYQQQYQQYQPYVAPQAIFPTAFILRYTPHQEPDPAVPDQLKSFFTDDVWAARIPAIVRTASRYYKHGLEWIWLILTFGSVIAVPIATYFLVLPHLPEDPEDKDDDGEHHFFHWGGFDRVWKARLIALAVWIALMFLFFMPMKIWKSKGKAAVNQMLAQWEAEDKAVRPAGAVYPTLKMKQPGIISKNIKINVVIPPGPAPSLYQPGARVPPYLANPPVDPAASQFYQQPQSQQQQQQQQQQQPEGQWGPPSAGWGNRTGYGSEAQVPLYNGRDERVPGYAGMPVAQPDEKNPFEDVKV